MNTLTSYASTLKNHLALYVGLLVLAVGYLLGSDLLVVVSLAGTVTGLVQITRTATQPQTVRRFHRGIPRTQFLELVAEAIAYDRKAQHTLINHERILFVGQNHVVELTVDGFSESCDYSTIRMALSQPLAPPSLPEDALYTMEVG